MTYYFTPEGFNKIKEELEHLKTIEEKGTSENVAEVVSSGELRENAAYEEALDDKYLVEIKIAQLKDKMRDAQVVIPTTNAIVEIGASVLIIFNNKKQKIRLVGVESADPTNGDISYNSPLGKAIFGKEKGDVIDFDVEGEKNQVKIIKIGK